MPPPRSLAVARFRRVFHSGLLVPKRDFLGRPRVRRCFHSSIKWSQDTQPESPPQAPGVPYESLTVGVPRETFPGEQRVALTPTNAALLLKKGFAKVLVEHHAGVNAQFLDEHYAAAGATLVSREQLFQSSDIMLKVRAPLYEQESNHIKQGSTVISFLYPSQNKTIVESLASRQVNAFAVCSHGMCTEHPAHDYNSLS